MYKRSLVFAACCLGMLIFGIVLTTLGSILPSVMEKFELDKISASSLMSLLSIGILTGSLIFGPVVDRYGYKSMLAICTLLILLGIEGIAFASEFWLLRFSIFLIGFGGGVINGGTNALVADISSEGKSANLSLLGVFFGIGAIGIPFLMGMVLEKIGYDFFMAMTGLVVIVPLFFFLFTSYPKPKHLQGLPVKEGLGLVRNVTLLILGFILFFESGMEITVGSWTSSFLIEEMSVATGSAVFFLSFYWFGMTLARLVLGYLLRKYSAAKVLVTCMAIAFCGALIMILSYNLILSIAGLLLIGIGFAAVFPVILGIVGELFPNLSGTAFSIVFVIALIGGTTLPFITGTVADKSDLRFSFIVIPASLIFMFLLFQTGKNKILKKV